MNFQMQTPEYVVTHWSRIVSLVAAALNYTLGEESVNSIFLDCVEGRKQLWSCEYGIAITQIIIHVTGKRECRIVLLSSEPHKLIFWLKDAREAITTWARHMECDFICAYGRPGWKRVFDKQVERVYTVFAEKL